MEIPAALAPCACLRFVTRRLAGSLLLAGCGRLEFADVVVAPDAAPDVAPDGNVLLAHDEDGDGLADTADPCPSTAGDAADGDGDGVGDACDPAPAVGRDRIRVFSTLAAGDQPFADPTGLVQEADGLRFTGVTFGTTIEMPVVNARIELGFEILGPVDVVLR